MSNIISISDLRKQFEEKVSIEDWKSFAQTQTDIIETYQTELKRLKSNNEHLEKMLVKQSSFALPLTAEEQVCITQINILNNQSAQRPLDLNEVKKLDLLVKNLKLIREESTIILNRAESLSEAELVAIATQSED